MAIYRSVQMSFWTDTKIDEDFSADEKYIYLYLLTNPLTNLCGCYEIGKKQIANQTGFGMDRIEKILDRMQNTHKVIVYSEATKEILVLHWSRYNWINSEKFRKALSVNIEEVKDAEFKRYLRDLYDGKDTVSIPYEYGMDTIRTRNTVSVTDTVTDTVSNTGTSKVYPYKEVVDYLNAKAGKNFQPGSKETQKHIKARIDDGFTLDDFKTVIDKKVTAWKGDPIMDDYLRPQTLFGTKFESYLNEKPADQKTKQKQPVTQNRFNNFTQRDYDYAALEQTLLKQQRVRDG